MRKQDGTFEQDIQCIIDPKGTTGAIFISNLEAATNPQTLAKHRIGAVITAARGHNLAKTLPPHIEYLYIPAIDHESFDISSYFSTAHQLLEEELPRTNVLVHCMAGVSRSATLVIAYLMKTKAVSFQTAFAMVKSRRPIISPNSAFIEQLKRLETVERNEKEGMDKSTSSSWYSPKTTPQPPSEQLYDAALRLRIKALLHPC